MNTLLLAGMTLATLSSGGGYALWVRRRLVAEHREREAESAEIIQSLEAEVVGLGRMAERLAAELSASRTDAGEDEALAALRNELDQLLRRTEEVRAESGERAERLDAQLTRLSERLDEPGRSSEEEARTDELLAQLEQERFRAQEAEETLRAAHAAELEAAARAHAELLARFECTLDLLKRVEGRLDELPGSEPYAEEASPETTTLPDDAEIDGPGRRILDLVVQLDACAVGTPERRALVRELDETLLGMRDRLGLAPQEELD